MLEKGSMNEVRKFMKLNIDKNLSSNKIVELKKLAIFVVERFLLRKLETS